jgi:sugar O-acyltransferase (sialic acid O-acetyltransferase NeuD family)
MAIEKLIILGFSEATITMILDILASQGNYPEINVVNNLDLKPTKEYEHPNFLINIVDGDTTMKNELITLGVIKPHLRKKVRETFKVLDDNSYVILISKNCDISDTVDIGKGVVINTMSCIAGHTKISDFVFINRNVSIGHHTTIGSFTTINPGVNIAGNVTVGVRCQIGIGVNIIDGIKIGNNTIIGAGSLVTKDIPNNVVAYGNPCKIIRENEA